MSPAIRNPLLLLVLGAAGLWGAAQLTWVTAEAFNDHSGSAVREMTGGDLFPGLTAVAIGSVAAVLGVALTRGLAARIVGVIVVVLGIAGAVMAFSGFAEADPDRVHSILTQPGEEAALTSQGAGNGGDDEVALPAWSQITDVESSSVGPSLAAGGALLILGAGALLLVSPPRRTTTESKYETPKARKEKVAEEGSGSMWESIEAGFDPTERDHNRDNGDEASVTPESRPD